MIIYFSEDFLKHKDPYGRHPESPKRLIAAVEAVKKVLGKEAVFREPSTLREDLLVMVHNEEYVEYVKLESMRGFHYIDTDTYVVKETYLVALKAVSSAWEAADKSFKEGEPALALVRPPGHHAGISGPAMNAPSNGFCIFNNAAASVRRFLELGLRVAVLDFDAHHGNGTQEIFWNEPRVLHVDIHEWGIYPGTGWFSDRGGEAAIGTKVNIPLPHYAGDNVYRWVLNNVVFKAIDSFVPDAVVVSAGFDPHYVDPLTTLRVSDETFEIIGSYLSRKLSEGVKALVIVLEGGYGDAVSRGIKSFIKGLLTGEAVAAEGSLEGMPRWFVEGVRKYLSDIIHGLSKEI